MKLHKKIKSKEDNSIKYILFTETDNLAVESTFIDKNDGKNIICLPTQTSCLMRCKFCHITDISDQIRMRDLKSTEMTSIVKHIVQDLGLSNDKTLLISFMGCGEPLLNVRNLVNSMCAMSTCYEKIRFAIATSIPKNIDKNFDYFISSVIKHKINVKVHFSLHYTDDSQRKVWMPNAENIQKSLAYISDYKNRTNNSVEIHYTLIDGVNDTQDDISFLIEVFKNTDICIKFLRYNAKDSVDSMETPIERVKEIMDVLNKNGVKTEYYVPPGRDVGGSCGQILTYEYLEHNQIKTF